LIIEEDNSVCRNEELTNLKSSVQLLCFEPREVERDLRRGELSRIIFTMTLDSPHLKGMTELA
jgi:hypothetical protein